MEIIKKSQLKKMKSSLRNAAKVAVEYENISSRKLGITGEIAEVLVCDKLGLGLLADPISSGYDAVDLTGKRYQIKAKRADHDRGRMSRFSKHEFDYAILITLDYDYEITGIWKATYKAVKPLIEKSRRRNPGIREFKRIAKRVDSKSRALKT